MSIFSRYEGELSEPTWSSFKWAALILALSSSGVVQADKITADATSGYGGWNLDTNVTLVLNGAGSTFNESDGSYIFSSDSDYTYQAEVDDGASSPTVMGYVLAKDWPVGEPPGIKVIHDDSGVKNGKPANCIMATSYLDGHYLDSVDPERVVCSSPFQTHKRYKLAMLPPTVSEGSTLEKGIDLVFNVEREIGTRDYQIFQKINNWTGQRLGGFTVEVGFGVGDAFESVSEAALESLHVSVPAEIWGASQLANFSAGLFGPLDQHTGERGFFDPFRRAGFLIDEFGQEGLTSSLHATTTLGSDYAQVPPNAVTPASQFGPWLPSNMLPYGIFFDDDGNPQTDAALLAWYGHNPTTGLLGWMGGAEDDFSAVDISSWGENLKYTMGEIDDLVNVGLNYIVTVGDIAPYNSFTIRITPTLDTSGTPPPAFVGQEPSPKLVYSSTVGAVEIAPSVEFVVGGVLTASVGDTDLNLDTGAIDTATVTIVAHDGGGSVVIPEEPLTLYEQGEDRGVFVALLPETFSNVPAGTIVTVSYVDDSESATITMSTTATASPPPPAVVPDIAITEFLVPESVFDGQSGSLKLTIKPDPKSPVPMEGSVLVTGSDGSEFTQAYTVSVAGKKEIFTFPWTGVLASPAVAEAVEWTATLSVLNSDSETAVADSVSAMTQINVKVGLSRGYSGTLPSGNTGLLSFTTEDLGCEFNTTPQFLAAEDIRPKPPESVTLTDGIVQFVIDGCTPGATVSITMDYEVALVPGATYWKMDKPVWRQITDATINGSVVTYSITDGGVNDDDGTVNGTIVDPSAAADPAGPPGEEVSPQPVPVGSPLILVFMALGLSLLAGFNLRQRQVLISTSRYEI